MTQKKGQKGFSLFETLIAMVILSTSILLLANSWSGSFLKLRKSQTSFEVTALIERKMAEVETKYRGKPLDDIPEEDEGEFDDKAEFTWRLKSKKLDFPDFSSSLTAQEGGADQMLMMVVKQLTEGLSKAVKEVQVTVVYNPPNAKKPLEFSVTTYFVDYTKDLGFKPGLPGG